MRQGTHASLPAAALNVPAAHAAHSRSDEAPGAAVSYVPAAQVVTAAHTRSAWLCGATDVYWPTGHDALCVAHRRSAAAFGAPVSYSSLPHTLTARHAAPFVASERALAHEHNSEAMLRASLLQHGPVRSVALPMLIVRGAARDEGAQNLLMCSAAYAQLTFGMGCDELYRAAYPS